MQLNHVNLSVPDIEATVGFFEKYFGFHRFHRLEPNLLVVLRNDDGFALTISNFGKGATFDYPRDFHVGFIVDSQDEVNRISQRLQDDGVTSKGPRHQHGAWGFYVKAPGEVTVEVASYN